MFIGRQKELKALNSRYSSAGFEFAVIYGRRRVGKSTLIKEFIKNKEAIYYMAIEGTKKENLEGLSKALFWDENENSYPSFTDYESMLGKIDSIAKSGKRMIIAIDEYPYLAASYPAISSIIQSHIDNVWKDSNLFLILCGSSMSFMEEQVLGYKSPLYGRRTTQLKIKPFSFFETHEFLSTFSKENQAILYGVTGGIPEYLSRISNDMSVDENIIQLFFDESGRLYEEPVNLMKQEMKEPMSYHSIISAIASGHSKMNEIATASGLETGGCSNQITSLINLGIVKKEVPFTENENSRRTLYSLEDSMFLFWYRFVRPNISAINRGVGEQVYYNFVKPQLNDFMGKIYEEICKQYFFQKNIFDDNPFIIGNIGRWWGNNKLLKRQEEIDIMSISDKNMILGECKWRNEKVDKDVIDSLFSKGKIFPEYNIHYYFFSKSGFTKSVIDEYKSNEFVHLISFNEM